ncbi:MAG: serine hydrolase [Candidatus Peribacteraceae bacterium]
MQWHTPRFSIACILISTILAVGIGFVLKPVSSLLTTCNRDQYVLLNPLIRCNSEAAKAFVGEYEDFEVELSEWIDRQKEAGVVDDVAVYFRDLSAGPWFGINERAEFVPSSLFKLPLLIAVLRASMAVDGLLDEQVSLSGAYMGVKNLANPEHTVLSHRDYTVIEVTEKMIVYSDNAAQYVLQQLLHVMDEDDEVLKSVYRDLGILNFYERGTLTVKAYASLFRVLYNARYLPPELSEMALDLLARSTFEDGLEKGIPPGVIIAHKFGIRDVPDEPSTKQLHDCGIVYHPVRPYLICIMTIGKDQYRNADIIGDISRRVYDAVNERVGS